MYKLYFLLSIVLSYLLYCGYSNHQGNSAIDLHIIGGDKATREEFPFMVSLQVKYYKEHFCGGSVIAERYILTAAHCIDPSILNDPSIINLWIGGITLSNRSSGVYRDVEAIFRSNYDDVTYDNDIAILKLKEGLNYSETIQPVEIIQEEVPPNNPVVLAGWGYTHEDGHVSSDDLLKIKIQTVDFEECRKMYQPMFNLTSNMICAHFNDDVPKDPCKGDSGGPLIYNGKQIGIVSVGIGCARKEYPGVYTNVAHYADWIQSVINGARKFGPVSIISMTVFTIFFTY